MDIEDLHKASEALIKKLDDCGMDDSIMHIYDELAAVKDALEKPSLTERLKAKGVAMPPGPPII